MKLYTSSMFPMIGILFIIVISMMMANGIPIVPLTTSAPNHLVTPGAPTTTSTKITPPPPSSSIIEEDSSSATLINIKDKSPFMSHINDKQQDPLSIYKPTDKKIEKPLQVKLDIDRYIGRWYEIFRKPMYFQNQCVSDVSDFYELNTVRDKDNNIIEQTILTNPRCYRKDGSLSTNNAEGFFQNPPYNTQLKISFLPTSFLKRFVKFAQGDYWVLALEDDVFSSSSSPSLNNNKNNNDNSHQYRYSLVGTPDKKYLWLLARTPHIPETDLDHFYNIAEKVYGFDMSDIIYTKHTSTALSTIP